MPPNHNRHGPVPSRFRKSSRRRRRMAGEAAEFVPTDIAGLTGWFDFSDVSTLFQDVAMTTVITTDGQEILAAENQAATPGYHLTQATTGPLYQTAVQNSLSVAEFNGTDSTLAASASILADAARTFILVLQKNGAVGAGSKTAWSLHANAQFYTNSATHATGWNFFSGTGGAEITNVVPTATNWNIAVLRLNSAASLDIFANGGTATNTNPHDDISTATAMSVGTVVGGTQDVDIDVGEILVYDSALATADLNTVGSYLGTKWNITWTAVA
jgi:hypothetical protein